MPAWQGSLWSNLFFVLPQAFTIRRAGLGDLSGILGCLHAAFAPYESNYTAAAYVDTVLTDQTLKERLQSMSIFVAVSDSGEIVGTIGCNVMGEKEGHLRGMAVLPAWQGAGMAGQLLKAAEAELRDHGCERVTLDTTAPLQRAAHFYVRNGYRATGKITDFFGMPLYEYARSLRS
jgi:N-acetylglutamate synthase-like GNAT family acetyltransferase